MLMLRCGLRVDEVAKLTMGALDLPRLQVFVHEGKGLKDRVVYVSRDAHHALIAYLKVRPDSRAKRVFLVEKGRCAGRPLSVRGIQKRMEHYARTVGVRASCHQLRHNGDPALECRCGSRHHPGSLGTHANKDHPEILPRLQS
jgi:site-specific recombinase XerC